MATEMQVNIDAMRQALARFTSAAATARSVLQSTQALGASLAGVWSGQASVTYQNTLNAWCEQDARVVAALENLCAALQTSITRLANAEHQASSLAGS